MHVHRLLAPLTAAALTTAVALTAAPAASAAEPLGTTSLASVLLEPGGPSYDKDRNDYDILAGAVLAVLEAKPDSPVALLADGDVALTAFLPDDKAFHRLVQDLTGDFVKSEQGNVAVLATLGIDTVETVLLNHVVAGATIDSSVAIQADGAELDTAAGTTLTVDVRQSIRIVDTSPLTKDAKVKTPDINVGNLQVAHGIDQVLLLPL